MVQNGQEVCLLPGHSTLRVKPCAVHHLPVPRLESLHIWRAKGVSCNTAHPYTVACKSNFQQLKRSGLTLARERTVGANTSIIHLYGFPQERDLIIHCVRATTSHAIHFIRSSLAELIQVRETMSITDLVGFGTHLIHEAHEAVICSVTLFASTATD